MIHVYLAIHLFFAGLAWRKFGLAPIPTFAQVYLLGAGIVLDLAGDQSITSNFLNIWSTGAFRQYANETHQFLAAMAAFVWASSLGIPATHKDSISLTTYPIGNGTFLLAVIGMWTAFLINIFSVDWGLLHFNTTYLAIGNPQLLLSYNSLTAFVHNSGDFIGLVATVSVASSIAARRYGWALLFSVPAVWFFSLALIGSSRYAVVYVAFFGIVLYFSADRVARTVVAIATATVGYATLLAALNGRNSGAFGYSQIGNLLNFRDPLKLMSDSIVNVFEGAFVFSEHFTRRISFSDDYALLSLSPLPSFIDGFDDIRVASEVRIHTYVPRSALDEVLQFGLVHASVYFLVLFWALRASLKVTRLQPIAGLAIQTIALLAFYLQFTYSTRTIIKFLLICLIAAWVAPIFRGRHTQPTQSSPMSLS